MIISLLAVIGLGLVAWFGSQYTSMQYLFGLALPMIAVPVFIAGFIWRIVYWAKSPVPFPIATTGGQERSLDWIKPERLDAPYTKLETVGRMVLEVLCFRSLFRNTSMDLQQGPRLVYYSSKWLWLFALAFHYCFAVVLLRHLRFFFEPVPMFVSGIEFVDGIMQVGVPRFYGSDALILGALLFLLLRRIFNSKVRYISLANDYFPLFLLIGIVGTGICMRYFSKVDIAGVKVLTMGLATLNPNLPANIGPMFFAHIFLVCILLVYFPFSKLMHMGGIFLSPTRNMPNNSRAVRHVNPWNPPKKHRTYNEYEDEFRDLMAEAGLPLEKQPDADTSK
ncbi:sulfate reduction electron transfer complex DsrMKJOP subunit DsrM [Desulfovibrio litoralis]|uniref:Putative sulfite reductase-associated electron transfer protein DsrM n=1 Tax=Desulfovibrio litoralis DSM 11393 TaxID=1121455 RepID=A0A1M7RZW1_9BACT|nr:sulfate reduction electron transfer complex DsrMKJOP subunit DsrM [Desulfovibrio litoralis]SHN51761.1 putative sulfite reductase-associated electron transfer protein DsrM [Desulfovibrio litoralis DSM 11393]